MEKVVVLLLSEITVDVAGLLDGLTGRPASELRRRGATGIQVNVVDPELGAPHGMAPGEGERLSAMLSYWVAAAGEQGVHTGLLPEVAGGRWCSYVVCESVRLAGPPASEDLGRSPGFTQIVPLCVPPSLSWAEWRRRWQGSHTTVAIETQSSFRYVQNLVVRPLGDRVPAFAAVVEESFPLSAATDNAIFYDAEGDPARLGRNLTRMIESCATFIEGRVPIAWTAEYRDGSQGISG